MVVFPILVKLNSKFVLPRKFSPPFACFHIELNFAHIRIICIKKIIRVWHNLDTYEEEWFVGAFFNKYAQNKMNFESIIDESMIF